MPRGDQQVVLQVAQVSDMNPQTKITLLADLVAGTVQAITTVIPSCQNAVSAHAFAAKPALKLQNFVTKYNALLIIKTGNEAVDAITPKLAIHQHSKDRAGVDLWPIAVIDATVPTFSRSSPRHPSRRPCD